MKKKVYTLDEIANRNKNFKKQPYRHAKKDSDSELDYNPYK